MHPSQFSVNEVWIFFKINDQPVSTQVDGDLDAFALMDAASLFMLGVEFVRVDAPDSSNAEIRRLLETAFGHKRSWAKKILVPSGTPNVPIFAEAQSVGVPVAEVEAKETAGMLREARRAFKEHFGLGAQY